MLYGGAIHFNIHLDDETGQQLAIAAKDSGESRNAPIRQAVAECLARHGKPQWPEAVRSFQGIADMPAFESSRGQLRAPSSAPRHEVLLDTFLIAGCGLARGLIVVTSNTGEFERVGGLLLENWH